MFNICPNCGEYRPDKAIVPEGAYAVCPNCGFKHKFIRLPLFILSGASGTGKSTISLALASKMKEVVVMESDILWHRELDLLVIRDLPIHPANQEFLPSKYYHLQ